MEKGNLGGDGDGDEMEKAREEHRAQEKARAPSAPSDKNAGLNGLMKE